MRSAWASSARDAGCWISTQGGPTSGQLGVHGAARHPLGMPLGHADWIIDRGPGPPRFSRIVFEGTPADLVAARATLTGEHLGAYVST
jgi:hypothetical protein